MMPKAPELAGLYQAKKALSAQLLGPGRASGLGMDHADPSVVALFDDQIRVERAAPYPAFGL